ncbi:hypothetical protein [uncultured Gulosibacter sp.]|uniref:hypothetical protein n=1 Tax=uncultured Gulosibacter sp. TaxID=1339167 RepID=UPI002889C8C0|nr:hypothetical protein [uncultured Gulosibacter sp.]
MVTWAEVRMWQPAPLEELIAEIDHDESVAQEQSEVLDDSIDAITSTGETADAARERLAKMRDAADKLEGLLTDALIATHVYVDGVRGIVRRVQGCYDYAATKGLVLHDNGQVSIHVSTEQQAMSELREIKKLFPNATIEATPLYINAQNALISLRAEVAKILEAAEALDQDYADALDRIARGVVSFHAWKTAKANGDEIGWYRETAGTRYRNLTKAWGTPQGSPAELRAHWDALSPAEQAALIEQYPELIGQLDGVPFDRRIEANNINIARTRDLAKSELAELRAELNNTWRFWEKGEIRGEIAKLEREIRYYDSLLEGPGAVLFDRANNRIIEVVGDINDPNINDVLTYVLPTGGEWSNFVSGEAQLVTRDQVERSEAIGSPTVGFVYKDGPWVEWGFGEQGNANNEFMAKKGAGLADFQGALGLEEFAHRADINIAGHSAGHSVVAASETHGARYDQVFSLAGSYMPAGWEPGIGTEYDHMTYGRDAIHALDPVRDNSIVPMAGTPHSSLAYEKHSFEAHYRSDDDFRFGMFPLAVTGTSPVGIAITLTHGTWGPSVPVEPIDSHWRVSQGADRNGPVLEAMLQQMKEK